MDILTFVAKSFEALAWPLAILVIACMFEDEIKTLLRRIKKATVAGQVIEMELAQAEEARNRLPPVAPVEPAAGEQPNELATAAVAVSLPKPDPAVTAVNPAGVVMELWQGLYVAMRDKLISINKARRLLMPSGRVFGRSDDEMVDSLSHHGFPLEQVFFLRQLKDIRDSVARSGAESVSASEVNRYRALVEKAIETVQAFDPPNPAGGQGPATP